MTQHDRLTAVEVDVGYLKTSQTKMENAITRIADDMHKLATAEMQRIEDRRTIERVFKAFDEQTLEMRRLWERTDQIIDKVSAYQKAQLEKELGEKNKWVWEIVKSGATIIVALILFKIGIR